MIIKKVFYIFSISIIIAVIYFLAVPTAKSLLATTNIITDSPYAMGGYFINYLAWAIENGVYPTEAEAISAVEIMAQSIKEAGGAWIREEIPWNFLEPYQDNWNFRLVDIVMQILNENGLNVLVLLQKTPDWAADYPEGTPPEERHKYPAKNIVDWENYIRTVVNRYGTNGTNQAFYWQIGGEVDVNQSLIPREGYLRAEEYYRLLKSASNVIRTQDPQAKVVFAGITSWDINRTNFFMNQVLDLMVNESLDLFDIMSIDLYGFTPEDDLYNTLQVLNERNLGSKPIWIAETNIHDYFLVNGIDYTINNVALKISWWYELLLENGADKVFWFYLLNWPDDPGGNFQTAGLLTLGNLEKQKTFYAFQKMARFPWLPMILNLDWQSVLSSSVSIPSKDLISFLSYYCPVNGIITISQRENHVFNTFYLKNYRQNSEAIVQELPIYINNPATCPLN